MRPLFDVHGQRVDLGRCLGRGGEGAVYSLPLRPQSVAKIYANRPDARIAEKLKAMVALATPPLASVAAWPQGLVLDRVGGTVVGFVMPRVDAHRPIHALYGPTDRAVAFPEATWAFLVRASRNLAAGFDTVHQHRHVLGDVNQDNVVASSSATVRFLDCDSFQITHEGRTYPCRVGVPLFTPPELHGKRLEEVLRTVDHDLFGLAVLVFQLLFMGRHPWAGRHPTRDMNMETAIREGMFAFGSEAVRQGWQPPPFSLRLTDIPSSLAGLFERALGREAAAGRPRPVAAEWVTVLEALDRNAVTCREDPRHVHLGGSNPCPWCRIEREGGPCFFLPSPGNASGPFDLGACWRAVEAVRSPGPAVLRAATLAPVPAPMPAAFVGILDSTDDRELRRRHRQAQTVQTCEQRARQLEERWMKECGDAPFAQRRRALELAKASYLALTSLEGTEREELGKNLRENAPHHPRESVALASANLPLAPRAPDQAQRLLRERQARRREGLEEELRGGLVELVALRRQVYARREQLGRELVEARRLVDEAKAGRYLEPAPTTPPSATPKAWPQRPVISTPGSSGSRGSLAPTVSWLMIWRMVWIWLMVWLVISAIPRFFSSPSYHAETGKPTFAVSSPAPSAPTAGPSKRASDFESEGANAVALVQAGRYDQAIPAFEALARKYPDNAWVYANLGIANLNVGRSEASVAALRRALALNPMIVEAHYYLGTQLVAQNKVPEAVRSLQMYLSMSPRKPENEARARKLLKALEPYLDAKKK
jgi:tetratricopeptide (TPR) repeat protein